MRTKRLRKWLALVVWTLCSINVNAYDFEVDGIYYTILSETDLTCAVSGDGIVYRGDVVIPENVTSDNKTYSVTWILHNAFRNCENLTEITIPNSVTNIGQWAFARCHSLTSITIPKSVTSIDETSFRECNSLTQIVVESGNPIYDSRDNCNAINETSTNTLRIGCKSTIVPNTITKIGSFAFYGCTGLEKITIPNSVTSIEQCAFQGCKGLKEVNIPNSVKKIALQAFTGCSSLTSIAIPFSVTSIDNSAFGFCSSITSIIVDKENSTYDSRDNCNAIIETSTNTLIAGCQKSTIPNTVTTIGNLAFLGNNGLTKITIPNSVTSIEQCAFQGCENLTEIIIPNSVENIGAQAVFGCTKLTSIVIPGSVTSIGNDAFGGCNLTRVVSRIEKPFNVNEMSNFGNNVVLYVPNPFDYNSLGGFWGQFVEIKGSYEIEESIDFTKNNIATFCSTNNLDFKTAEGIKAYIATRYDEEKGFVYFKQIDVVPAYTGVLVVSESNYTDYYILYSEEQPTLNYNLLKGITSATTIEPTEGEYTNYVLSNGKFYKVAESGLLGSRKAYLQLPTAASAAKSISFAFDDNTTGIKYLETTDNAKNVYYDLQGRKVLNPTKGLYINNGKKVVIK